MTYEAPPPSDEPDEHMALVYELDAMEQEVTAWEADFLETCLTQSFPLTTKQRLVVVTMSKKYLDS